MTGGKWLIDPLCLCGRPHPCPVHGQWAHTSLEVRRPVRVDDGFDAFTLLRLMDEPISLEGGAYTRPA